MDSIEAVRTKMLARRNGFGYEYPVILGLHTKETLFEHLGEHAVSPLSISDETYGPNSMIYIEMPEGEREKLEDFLSDKGHIVHRDYYLGHDVVEVQVEWFPGNHWDE